MRSKQLIIAVLTCAFAMNLRAQESTPIVSDSLSTEIVSASNELAPDFQRRHEIDVNFGVPSCMGATMSVIIVPLVAVASSNKYDMDFKYVGLYGINYHYQILKWLKFGGKIAYEGYKTNYFVKNSTVLDHQNTTSLISIMPSVQFTYLNREHVQLYSGLDLGCTLLVLDKQVGITPMGNITPIGVNWGGHVYGLFEINVGGDAIAKIGMGYRIDQ